MIERPRLQSVLTHRFEVPVTTITGPAGAGKSSAVQLAIADNALDPRGRDVVIELRPHDAERAQLIDRIAESLNVSTDAAAAEDDAFHTLYDSVWSAAPDDVAIWIDDAHLLDENATSALGTLLDRLPTNGHLVIVSRRPILRGIARRRVRDEVVEIGPSDLQLDDEELGRLAVDLKTSFDVADDAPRHAATAALIAATGGTTASIQFLQEEVIGGLRADRVDALRRLVAVQSFDPPLARVLTDDPELDVDEIVDGLPLVARHGDRVTLHELLRDAIASEMSPGEVRKVRSKTGEALAARHDDVGAIDAFLAAGDEHGARAVARRYIARPTLAQTATDTRSILRRISTTGDDVLIAAFEAAQEITASLGAHDLGPWHRLRQLSAGRDDELEALALHRIAQEEFFDFDSWDDVSPEAVAAYERLVELSDSAPLARGAAAHIASQSAQQDGRTDRALAALTEYGNFDEPDCTMMRQQRLVDLGFVERVGQELTPDQLADLPVGAELFVGYAMWLRGEAPPEFAEAMVRSMIASVEARGQPDTLTSTIGTAVPIALACGDVRTATERLVRLREVDRVSQQPRRLRLFLALSEALVAAVEESDEQGIERLASFGRWTVIHNWPQRPHLLALPFCYLAQPERRPALDAMQTGPAITRAIDVGKALAALREQNDPAPSSSIAWSERTQLRNLVLPHHLAELACAADADGHPTARAILDELPDPERILRRVADQGAPIAAERAAELLGDLPRTAPPDLRLRLLGSPVIERADATDDSSTVELGARGRITELLAFLALRGPSGRDDVIDHLWGGYDDDDKASANLRATITQAHKLLQPGRSRSETPAYLRAVGSMLALHHVRTDVEEFERRHELGRAADTTGTPRSALVHYLEAMTWFRGDLLAGDDAGWIILDRVRLRSLAAGMSCRIAELVAAQGEVEDSASWARRALTYEPLSDRAALAFVRALAASGDQRNAAVALQGLLDERREAGVTPAPALVRLTQQLPDLT